MSDAPAAPDFDDWYTSMAASPQHDAIVRATLGLPPKLESSSLLPWDGIAEVVTALSLSPGDVLVDLACGRGGYGLEIARRTGALLLGVDFSAVAIELAKRRVQNEPGIAAEFLVGELTRTGLPSATAAAVMCVDAMQFADPYPDGFAECGRILMPGGRLVVTGWEPLDPAEDVMPQRLRRNIGQAMSDSGFTDVEVRTMPQWQQAERDMWEAAVAADADGDPAMESMREEGANVLTWAARGRRVLATARAAFV